MSEYTKLFERAGARYEAPSLSAEGLLLRRDRKRRNQRIAAGVVGIAVFAAAVWIVTSIAPLLDRSERSVVPAGGATGPAVTGPTPAPDSGWDGRGLPPEEAVPSTPEEGKLVAGRQNVLGPDLVYVYDDGRVLTRTDFGETMYERRLTPEGVELVRSGAVSTSAFLFYSISLPAGTWADSEARPYVPSRYAICGLDPHRLGTLPPRAEALLRSRARPAPQGGGPRVGTCFEVTTEEARSLEDIFIDADFDRIVGGGGDTGVVALTFVPADRPGGSIALRALLPTGDLIPKPPG